jgi:hypothetical protein
MTRRSLIVVLCAAMGIVSSSCGSDDEQANKAPAPAPTAAETVASQRLGCGEYCQNAGGYGGGEDGEILMRIETHGHVAPVENGVPVELTCLLSEPCKGAILIDASSPDFVEVGRSDMLVDGGSTATLTVPMLADGLAALERGGGRLRVEIIADYGDPECPPGSILPCTATGAVVIDQAAP